jgi:hypothetical protein
MLRERSNPKLGKTTELNAGQRLCFPNLSGTVEAVQS